MHPEEHGPEASDSVEELTAVLLERAQGASAPERMCNIVAGALRTALRAPEAARRLLLRWQVEQVAGDAIADAEERLAPAGEPARPGKRRICLDCSRRFTAPAYRGGWCDAACFARWSADLPPEPPAR
jgi:hypothetical protein